MKIQRRYFFVIGLIYILIYLLRCPRQRTNSTKKSNKLSISSLMAATDCEVFHLITMFYNGYAWQGFEGYTLTDLNEREKELLQVLQSNLNHKCIKKVHLFYYNKADLETIDMSNLTNMHKLVLVNHTRLLHMYDIFAYASTHLVDRAVIAGYSDIAFGEGLEFIDIERLKENKLLFSLSRFETPCNTTAPPVIDMCDSNMYGKNSAHDSFIFRLSEPLNDTLLRKLDYPINMLYAGNGLISTMRTTFHYTVKNPCLTIKTYHYHCSTVYAAKGQGYSLLERGWKKTYINQNGMAKPITLEQTFT